MDKNTEHEEETLVTLFPAPVLVMDTQLMAHDHYLFIRIHVIHIHIRGCMEYKCEQELLLYV